MIQNQTIILIHGAGSISDAWDNFKKSFESMGNTVINPTLRYHQRGYKSDPKLGNTSILDYVEDIEKIIKKLQQKQEILFHNLQMLLKKQKSSQKEIKEIYAVLKHKQKI